MRRFLPLLTITILLTVLITAVTLAQDNNETGTVINSRHLDSNVVPGAMIDGVASPLPAIQSMSEILALTADDPADSCQDAPILALDPERPGDGISYDVRDATEAADDPQLSCMWGNPSRPQGYRTVWYQLNVPASGRITLDTFSSAYDTVLGVFSGGCDDLKPVRCNDDTNGFASETTISVSAGETYYIEVADWQPGIPADRTLNFSALLQRLEPLWQVVETKVPPTSTSTAISRHSTASLFDMLYVIGGQSVSDGVPSVSNRMLRLNTFTKLWEDHLASIPGAGYSNTTAAHVGERIYVPSGFDGHGYDGLHWAYTIDQDRSKPGYWSRVADVPKVNGNNFAWAASAVPPSNDRYYLMGGTSSTDLFDTQTVSNRAAFEYVANQDQWSTIAPMKTARYAHTGTWLSTNNLGACVAGGLGVQTGGTFVFHTSAECFHPNHGWRFAGDMNIARIGAGSVTGPDGKWYVFGGLTALDETTLVAVLQTEVYDPVRNTWTLLPPEYNLGGQDLNSARAFASGSMVGNTLYVTGGSIFFDEVENAIASTERIFLPSNSAFVPALIGNYDDLLRPDDNFEQARLLIFGQIQERNFSNQRDFFDYYTFLLQSTTDVEIKLEVPDDNDFDLFLYGENKLLWGSSAQPLTGEDESIKLRLEPRRYYVVVQRSFPTAQPDKGAHYKLVLLN